MDAKTEHELHQRPSNVGASVQIEPAKLTAIVDEAARVLGLLANSKRLLILCCLVEHDELNVTALASRVGLSQSALSQHLAVLRDDGLVSTRREAQTIYYTLAAGPAERSQPCHHGSGGEGPGHGSGA